MGWVKEGLGTFGWQSNGLICLVCRAVSPLRKVPPIFVAAPDRARIMYFQFYGFESEPFSLTPDSRFLYLSNRHEEALAALIYGINHRKGFIAITGEVGSGKTTLCRTFMNHLDRKGTEIALILNPDHDDLELLQSICAEFGLPDEATSKRKLLQSLNEFLLKAAGTRKNCVLIIDEAQNLSPSALEQVRMISNLETETDKLIQIVLVGQPELDDLLHRPDLEQLNQRITVRYHLGALDEPEVRRYVDHRIRVAKPSDPITFTDAAIRLLYTESRGIPRRINVICDRALLVGYVEETHHLDAPHIRKAIEEVSGSRPSKPAEATRKEAASLIGQIAREGSRTPSPDADRPPSLAELRARAGLERQVQDALEEAQSGGVARPAEGTGSSRRPRRSWIPVVAAALSLAFGVAIGAGLALKNRWIPREPVEASTSASLPADPAPEASEGKGSRRLEQADASDGLDAGREKDLLDDSSSDPQATLPRPSPWPPPEPWPPPTSPSPTFPATPTPPPSPTPPPEPTEVPTPHPDPTSTPADTPTSPRVESEPPQTHEKLDQKSSERMAEVAPWTVDADGIVRVNRDDLTRAACVLTWLLGEGKTVDLESIKAQPPERIAGLDLATGRPPLWLRRAELPSDPVRLAEWDRPCLLEITPGVEGLSPWLLFAGEEEEQAVLLDPRRGRLHVPLSALQPSIRVAHGLYFDPDDLAAAEPGEESERIARLKSRLLEEGVYLEENDPGLPVFDRWVSVAVAAFQNRYGLDPTGTLNPVTAWLLLGGPGEE